MNNMQNKNKRVGLILFIIGVFSSTQIQLIGSIAIAEIYIFLAAPIFLVSDFPEIRKYGFGTALGLMFMALIGVCLSSLYNHSPFYAFSRGFAHYYGLIASFLVAQHFIRRDISSYKWLMFGSSISSIITIFAFRRSIETMHAMKRAGTENITVDDIVSGPLFWIQRLSSFLLLPIQGWYLKMPRLYSIIMPFALTVFSFVTSESGRSAALCGIGGTFLILLGGKSIATIKKFQKRFILVLFSGMFLVIGFKIAYSYAATHGLLSEKATAKYELQTKGGTDTLHLLMGGRPETFVGILAAKDSPVFGFGPWAVDDKGYWAEYLSNYGTVDDLRSYYATESFGRVHLLPSHSHIVGSWHACGIMGVFIWIYLIYLCVDCLNRRIYAVPELFGWIAIAAPNFLWHICFSPFVSRISSGFVFAVLLTIRAIEQGKIQYSWR